MELPEIADLLFRAAVILAGGAAAGLAVFRTTRACRAEPVLTSAAWRWWLAALAASSLQLLAQPARFTGDFADTFSAEWLTFALTSAFGTGLMLGIAALALLAGSLRGSGWLARLAALAGLLLFATAASWTGHSRGGDAGAELPVVIAMHLACFSLWWGALLSLLSHARHAAPCFADSVRAFSSQAGWWFPLLPLSGLWLAVRLIGAWPAAFTPYHRLLVVKLVLFVAATAVAALNRWHWGPRMNGAGKSGTVVVRAIRVEVALVTAIVLVTLWMTTWSAPD